MSCLRNGGVGRSAVLAVIPDGVSGLTASHPTTSHPSGGIRPAACLKLRQPPGVFPPGAGDGVGAPPPPPPPLLAPELLLPVPSPVWPPTRARGPGVAPQPKTEASGDTGPAPVALPELEFPAGGSLGVGVPEVLVGLTQVVVPVEVDGECVVLPQPASASTISAEAVATPRR